jgi:hypothetical protein
MVRTTKIKSTKLVTTFELTDEQHNIACDRLVNDEYGNIMKDNYFLTIPEDTLVKEWIVQCIKNGCVARESFLKSAVEYGAKIYTMYMVVPGTGAIPVGDIAVTYNHR